MHPPEPSTAIGHALCGVFIGRLKGNIEKIEAKNMERTIQKKCSFPIGQVAYM